MLESLLEAYRAARYHVRASPEFVLRIDEPSTALDALLESAGVSDCAYVTAYNPGLDQRSDGENLRAHAALEAELRARGLRWVCAHSTDAQGGHHEEGMLVLGLAPADARELGRRFRQAAVVTCRAGGRPQLLPCDE